MDKQKPPSQWSFFLKLAEIYRDIAKNATPTMQFFLALAFLLAVFGIIWKVVASDTPAAFFAIIGAIVLLAVLFVTLEIAKILSKKQKPTKAKGSSGEENESPAPGPAVAAQAPVQAEKPIRAAESPIPVYSGDHEAVKTQLELARRILAMLEEQESRHTAATYPAHLRLELEDQRKKVAELEKRLKQ